MLIAQESQSKETGPECDFRRLNLEVHYQGRGEVILSQFIAPVLEKAVRYDRLTSFFDARALLSISHGLDAMWHRKGKMRLILGVHSVPHDLLHASVPGMDWTQDVIDALRKRLMSQVSTISDEMLKNRIATLAWMMKDRLLEVRVAAPSGRSVSGASEGMFHMKHFVFEDSLGNLITAVGSPNETSPGMSTNFEEITVHMSWRHGSSKYIEAHTRTFEDIWNGTIEGLSVRRLDDAFANELLQNLKYPLTRQGPGPGKRQHAVVKQIIDIARRSPVYSLFNSGSAALYPHQERAFLDGMSRWPIRVLFADEVGLGKTLEVGAAISYLHRFGAVHRVVILAPKNLLRQWQDELRLHFGLAFWIYDSSTRTFISPSGEGRLLPSHESPVGESAPDLIIVSAQLARGMRSSDHMFKKVKRLPDLLVIDEAHAARLKLALDGKPHPTRLFNLVKELSPKIQHIILVTATPLQMHWMEYHATLSLLGLPEGWADGATYERSLRILASPNIKPSLEDAKWVLRGIDASLSTMKVDQSGFTEVEKMLGKVASSIGSSPSLDQRMRVIREWNDAYPLFVKLHPGHLLTIRNTRSLLEKYGYRFPERNLQAPMVSVPPEVVFFYEAVDKYLSEAYGKVEDAANPGKHNIGFAKCTYQQRLASSLHAAELSLTRRLNRIEWMSPGTQIVMEESDEDEPEEEDIALPSSKAEPQATGVNPAVASAVAIERLHIKTLLESLVRLQARSEEPDPKISQMLGLMDEHLGKDKMLVFSHYTDTLDGCLDAFFRHFAGRVVPAHALYTGKEQWMDRGDGKVPASKEDIKNALNEGWLSVVFCSDAASEGLNLQAAKVIINIDVPWNPAKLEQRIGRIDRLGQLEKSVDIYNLWYPDSVEARMYQRLLGRREDYQLAVGETPELISEAIRVELAHRLGSREMLRTDPFEKLQSLRQASQHKAMRRVWDTELDAHPISTMMRNELLRLLHMRASEEGWGTSIDEHGYLEVSRPGLPIVRLSAEPGRSDSLTLLHPLVDMLSEVAEGSIGNRGESSELAVLEKDHIPYVFCLKGTGKIRLVPPERLPDLIDAATGARPIQDDGFPVVDSNPDGSLLQDSITTICETACRWLPKHSAARMVVPNGVVTCLPPGEGMKWGLRVIGSVSCS
jgi:superfamily II DNA or RNA helicase